MIYRYILLTSLLAVSPLKSVSLDLGILLQEEDAGSENDWGGRRVSGVSEKPEEITEDVPVQSMYPTNTMIPSSSHDNATIEMQSMTEAPSEAATISDTGAGSMADTVGDDLGATTTSPTTTDAASPALPDIDVESAFGDAPARCGTSTCGVRRDD